ncbi:DUF2922 domain-containing protein [Aneurinibacillus sp. REN35]|uniref:DUF2922 domain-containing protein n=1 Tax=Aneurinibacillus sp. REN35 TaxID=3237286 RepID=UPI003528278C
MKTLELTFAAQDGSTLRLTLPNPKLPVDPVQVAATMDLLIAKQIFTTTTGTITGKKNARVIDQTASVIPLA